MKLNPLLKNHVGPFFAAALLFMVAGCASNKTNYAAQDTPGELDPLWQNAGVSASVVAPAITPGATPTPAAPTASVSSPTPAPSSISTPATPPPNTLTPAI